MADLSAYPALMSVNQVAEALCMSKSSVHSWVAGGLLRYVRTPGGQIRVPRALVAELLVPRTRAEHLARANGAAQP